MLYKGLQVGNALGAGRQVSKSLADIGEPPEALKAKGWLIWVGKTELAGGCCVSLSKLQGELLWGSTVEVGRRHESEGELTSGELVKS